uniref:Ig-like domain-containing protein n=1 Tax=Lates calcarifer TaxID=8187 RepID=A0A4W6ER75_LATCA
MILFLSTFHLEPSVEVLLVPSEGSESQKLFCSGWGFNPQIKWLSESREIPSNSDITMGADGRVAVTSQVEITQTEWKTGNDFRCEVSDKSLNKKVNKSISLCSAKAKVVLYIKKHGVCFL